MFIITKETLLAAVDAAIVNMGPTGMHVRLYKNPISPSIDSVIGDFTEADYTGYAAIALTGANPAVWASQGAAAEYLIPAAVFQPTGTTVTNIIYGYYITLTGTPDKLIGAEQFATPIGLGDPSDQLIIATVFGIADAGLPGVIY